MKYGEVIKNIRLKKGFTQEDFVDKLNISQTYLSLIESNKKQPTVQILERISALTEIPLYYFMFKALEIKKDVKKNKRKNYQEFEPVLSSMIEKFFID